VAKLSTENSAFFVHIDRKSRIEDFSGIEGPNVFFCEPRLAVYWAEYSGVRAVMALVRQALAAPRRFDYLVLLSGSEYPLRTSRYIEEFLEKRRGQEFISLVKVPNEAAGKPLARVNTLWMPSTQPVRHLAARALGKMGYRRDYREALPGFEPYAGNTWWTLSAEACRYAIEFAQRNPHVERFFEQTFSPEELFFHTILGNSEIALRARRNLVYEDWSRRGRHPEIIGEEHVALFEAMDEIHANDGYGPEEVLFARKFDGSRPDLLDRIDDMARRKDDAAGGGIYA
jgi:hypothetical protein